MKLREYAQEIIAYKFLTSITGKISDRAKRRFEKSGQEASERLKAKETLKDSDLILSLRWSDEAINWARKINLALEEFKQTNPKAYEQFEEIRDKHKDVRRAYLEFGGEIPDEHYVRVIQEIIPEMSKRDSVVFYNKLKIADRVLSKEEKGLQSFLLPE
jgi:cell fate (sporulation/competence/biofilm development) regulator YlbF (YheA/YmcA/DUF963 family)